MYSKILKDTLRLYDKLPVIIPEKGVLAGFAREFWCPYSDAFKSDNHHYPMGTTFLKYGIKGVAKKARRNISPTKNKMENELLEGIAIVYDKIAEYFSKYVSSLDEKIQSANDEEKQRLDKVKNIKPKIISMLEIYHKSNPEQKNKILRSFITKIVYNREKENSLLFDFYLDIFFD